MKFLTENDLRELYKNQPFTSYILEKEVKLTPGARQFLVDRKIEIIDYSSGRNKQNATFRARHEKKGLKEKTHWKDLRLKGKLKSVEALFLLTGEELLSKDVRLAQEIVHLYKQFSQLLKALNNNQPVEKLTCHSCKKINEDNFSTKLEDCFEISEFHIQLDRGRELLLLHHLRCVLQEIEPLVLEISDGSQANNPDYEELICNVNQIINRLSQIICSTMGGETCLIKH